ncbi:MAG TPA: glycosyltransferase family 87 protein [Phenylobacterium sp.]|uniref:glycosyltransferase family 87 protein n=1 Tax=Phenylobacterium sp. TaxID=1871053 RepID=UPI002B491BA0|nr:glycosyltransferase family 87 protein [Phenylobacterium sp.]HKR90637.1 glycosyltransferase family 87 protein [Phenylobacterium sp.]HKT53173.1 glycosyltransferase family 87 protein [Caulobacteraceae bacterium]
MLKALRDAAWLKADRAKAWRNALLAASGAGAAALVSFAHGGLDPTGKPLGTDFVSFYAASELVLAGQSAAVYDPQAHRAAEIAIFGRDLGYFAFFYPPMFLLTCAPLAMLSYLGALATWLAATFAAFAASLRGWLDRRIDWATVVAFPAVFLTLGHGQNAFLTAALFSVGGLWLERRPILAGIAFGLLGFKPHLGIMLPVALAAGGRWKTIAAAAATLTAFAAMSYLAFGANTWRSFLASSALARTTLEQGILGPKMMSAFAAVRVLGGSVALAYALQAVATLAVGMALVGAIRRRPGPRAEAALLMTAALLATPFLLDYDLVILAAPLAWLTREGLATGFRPWEKIGLLSGYVLPLAARSIAIAAHAPLAPIVLAAIFCLILRRTFGSSANSP